MLLLFISLSATAKEAEEHPTKVLVDLVGVTAKDYPGLLFFDREDPGQAKVEIPLTRNRWLELRRILEKGPNISPNWEDEETLRRAFSSLLEEQSGEKLILPIRGKRRIAALRRVWPFDNRTQRYYVDNGRGGRPVWTPFLTEGEKVPILAYHLETETAEVYDNIPGEVSAYLEHSEPPSLDSLPPLNGVRFELGDYLAGARHISRRARVAPGSKCLVEYIGFKGQIIWIPVRLEKIRGGKAKVTFLDRWTKSENPSVREVDVRSLSVTSQRTFTLLARLYAELSEEIQTEISTRFAGPR
jgi:hypothetical protein